MDFRSLNDFNIFMNTISGNFLPTTDKRTKLPILFKIYIILVWLIKLTYLTACFLGFFNVSRERALKDGLINIVILVEIVVLLISLHNSKKLIRGLIGKLNHLLIMEDQVLGDITTSTVTKLKKPLQIYTIANVSAVIVWVFLPVFEVFRRNEFYHTDYQVPIVLCKEPFSAGVFIGGVVLEIVGCGYILIKKVGLDLYMIHFILLITAQYKYLRTKFATVLGKEDEILDDFYDDDRQFRLCREEKIINQEIRSLTRRYEIVVETAVMLKKLLSPKVGILYIINVFRFCFLSFMFVTSIAFEKYLIVLYTLGALTQFYILCYSIQELFEASITVADDILHEKWYLYGVSFQKAMMIIISTNKLKCTLSNFQNIDLTLPSFMLILNQAYSISLLFSNTNIRT